MVHQSPLTLTDSGDNNHSTVCADWPPLSPVHLVRRSTRQIWGISWWEEAFRTLSSISALLDNIHTVHLSFLKEKLIYDNYKDREPSRQQRCLPTLPDAEWTMAVAGRQTSEFILSQGFTSIDNFNCLKQADIGRLVKSFCSFAGK